MNELSWLLYAAEVLEALGRFFSVAAYGSGIVALTMAVTKGISSIAGDDAPEGISVLIWRLAGVFLVAGFFAVAIPSKQTIYMIVALEIGETVVTDPENIAIMSDVRRLVKRELSKALEE